MVFPAPAHYWVQGSFIISLSGVQGRDLAAKCFLMHSILETSTFAHRKLKSKVSKTVLKWSDKSGIYSFMIRMAEWEPPSGNILLKALGCYVCSWKAPATQASLHSTKCNRRHCTDSQTEFLSSPWYAWHLWWCLSISKQKLYSLSCRCTVSFM